MTSIHTNVGALVAQRGMDDSMQEMNSAMNRLSTGYRINSAADDAAGSAIASKWKLKLVAWVLPFAMQTTQSL